MAAYWIGRTRILEPQPFEEYVRQTALATQKYPLKVLARGGSFEILEGEQYFNRFVIYEFPDMEAARALYYCAEYQRGANYRRQATGGRADIVLTEGIVPGQR